MELSGSKDEAITVTVPHCPFFLCMVKKHNVISRPQHIAIKNHRHGEYQSCRRRCPTHSAGPSQPAPPLLPPRRRRLRLARPLTHVRQARTRVQGWDPLSVSNIHFQGFEIARASNARPEPESKVKFPSQLIPSMKASITLLREPVYSFVRGISSACGRVVVVYDSMMAHTVQDVCNVPNAEAYCFQSISAFSLYSFYWEYAGKPDTLPPEAEVVREVPSRDGCFDPEFAEISSLIKEAPKCNYGDIYNTSRVIVGFYLDLLAKEKVSGRDKIWAIGPFHPLSLPPPPVRRESEERGTCLKWLDEQEPGSVVYVAFGSTTSLSGEETKEMARGLERSGHKFIWVLREADRGDVFDGEEEEGRTDDFNLSLPQGFEQRVEGRGLIVRDWAPQLEILGHTSTGGFISHCGWNSCIESISTGVPMATWPCTLLI